MSNDQVTMIAALKLIACLAFSMAATGVKKGVQSTRGLVPLMWHAALCGSCMWLAGTLKKTLHHLITPQVVTPQVERKKKKYINVEKSHKSARVSPML